MGWMTSSESPSRGELVTPLSQRRLYAICGLLLLASAINYMDRQTLANVGVRVTTELSLKEQQFGALETVFGMAFAAGSLIFGFLADRLSIRWLYPLVLLLWSTVGFMTGFIESYSQLLLCRGLLGFFEAGHWPCGLKATQALLNPGQRPLGNSVLQSGTSIGAIITPLVMGATLTAQLGSWRYGFQLVGALGLFWIVAWLWLVRSSDLHGSGRFLQPKPEGGQGWWREVVSDIFSRRMIVVLTVITIINATWQTLRAWLPKVMQQEHGYSEGGTLLFTSIWYAVTDIGCLGSGLLAFWLVKRGFGIKYSRAFAFSVCACLCAFLALFPWLPPGPVQWLVLLLSGAGALGMFPIYYAFSQDISRTHQGKITGITSAIAWVLSSPTQMLFGYLADTTRSFHTGLILAALAPLLAIVVILLLWPSDRRSLPLRVPIES